MMIKTIITLMFMMLSAPQYTAKTDSTYVYICTGPSSTKYHKTSKCRGLNSCSRDIVKVTIEKAKELGRKPCKLCY